MKHIICTIAIVLGVLISASAQSTLARLKFEDAEAAYQKEDYATTLSKLKEAMNLLGSTNPTIEYLRILTLDKQYLTASKEDKPSILQELDKGSANFLKQYDGINGIEDKFRDIYRINEKYSSLANREKRNNIPQFEEGEKLLYGKKYSEAFQKFTEAAALGSDRAMTQLGNIYSQGLGVEVDHAKAVEWYTKGVNGGNYFAMYYLGDMYAEGTGVTEDDVKANELFLKSAENGYGFAMGTLGYRNEVGIGTKIDFEKAVDWYTRAWKNGYDQAAYRMGNMYLYGKGVPENAEHAREWYLAGADKGELAAIIALAGFYRKGVSTTRNMSAAIELYQKAADQNHRPGISALAEIYFGEEHIFFKNYSKALNYLIKLAEMGDINALEKIARIYTEGGDGISKDYDKALEYYLKAEGKARNQGVICYAIATFYMQKNDAANSFKYFLKGANEQHALSASMTSYCYDKGFGVQKDNKQAKYWQMMSKSFSIIGNP